VFLPAQFKPGGHDAGLDLKQPIADHPLVVRHLDPADVAYDLRQFVQFVRLDADILAVHGQ
jgi:hypothetical protein